MAEADRIKIKELTIWLKDQLSHPRTLFKWQVGAIPEVV